MSGESTKLASGIDVYLTFQQQYAREGKDPQTAERLALRAASEFMTTEETQQVLSGNIPASSTEEQGMLDQMYRAYRSEGADEVTSMRKARAFVGC